MTEEQQLINAYKLLDAQRLNFKKDRQYGFDLMPYSFFLRVRPLKTQMYGLRVQAYFAYHMDFVITPSSWDLGDFKTKSGHDIEFKCSFIDGDAQCINVKQIRNWQDLDYYYIFTVDFRDYSNIKYKCYELSKAQMIQECELMNAKPVANTKDKNNTEFASLGFSIDIGSTHYERWEKTYLNKKFNIDSIVEKNLLKIHKDKSNNELIEKQKEYIKQLEEQLAKLQENIVEEKHNLSLMLLDKSYENYKTLFNLQTMLGSVFHTTTVYNRVIENLNDRDLSFKLHGTDFNYFLRNNKISNLLTDDEKLKVREFIKDFYRLSETS